MTIKRQAPATVCGNNKDPRPKIVDYLRDVMVQIGYKAKTKILDAQVYYATVGDRKTKAQAGFTGWSQDFPHPADFFQPNLSESALASNPSFNLQFKNDPELDAALAKLNPEADPTTVADQWAEVDKLVIERGHATAYGNELSTSFFSERMDFENCSGVHPVYKNDWSLFCLK